MAPYCSVLFYCLTFDSFCKLIIREDDITAQIKDFTKISRLKQKPGHAYHKLALDAKLILSLKK